MMLSLPGTVSRHGVSSVGPVLSVVLDSPLPVPPRTTTACFHGLAVFVL